MTQELIGTERYKILPDGRWEIYLDATQDGNFGVCPQLYKYGFMDNLTPKGERPWARDLGSWWSTVMENTYAGMHQYQQDVKMNRPARPPSHDSLVNMAAKAWSDLDMNQLEKIHPRSYKQFGGQHGALSMIAEYIDRQLPIDYNTWTIISAEASFGRKKEVKVGETDKVILYWLGQPDLFVIFNKQLCPVDHKSVDKLDSRTIKRYKPHIQLPGYVVAARVLMKELGYEAQVDRCIVNAVARTDSNDKAGNPKPRFQRLFIQYTESELNEWRRKRLRKAERLRNCIETGEWDWNEYACSNQWGRPCSFQNVCEKTPDVRPIIIATDYLKREPWVPGMHEKKTEEAE